MKKVSIITVNYNQPRVTEELLASIAAKNTYSNIEIIVIDNGSIIDPLPEWKKKYEHVNFLRSDNNLGFAGGNNLGIKAASGDYFFLVNNDTEFTENLVERLVQTLEAYTEAGAVSPKIHYFNHPGIIQYAGFTPMNYFLGRNKCIGEFEKDLGQYDHLTGPTGFAHGAAMMVKKEAIKKAGLMNEHFFLYYEEMDWCEKIKQSGYAILIEPKALIYHKESASVGQKSALKEFFMNRNRILFIRKNAGPIARLVFYVYFSIVVFPRNLFSYLKDKRTDLIPWLFKACWWNITHKKNSPDLGFPINQIR